MCSGRVSRTTVIYIVIQCSCELCGEPHPFIYMLYIYLLLFAIVNRNMYLKYITQKSLKKRNEQSESVYRRRTDNTKVKVQQDKQRSTKHTHKTKDRVTRTPLKTGGDLMCSGRVGSSCSTSGTRRVNLVTNRVISHELGKDRQL